MLLLIREKKHYGNTAIWGSHLSHTILNIISSLNLETSASFSISEYRLHASRKRSEEIDVQLIVFDISLSRIRLYVTEFY